MVQKCVRGVIDLGNWWTLGKFKGCDNIYKLRSKVQYLSNDDYPSMTGETYKYFHEGLEAIVGEGAKQHKIERDKSKNDAYKILTHTLLSQVANGESTVFDIVINYPLDLYNETMKHKFEDFIKTPDNIQVMIDKVRQVFHIRSVECYPQVLPVAFANQELFVDEIVGIIDIGGGNQQGLILDNLTIVPDTKFTEDKGCINLYTRVKNALNNELSINIREFEVEKLLIKGNGLPTNTEKSLRIIESVFNEYLEELKVTMQSNNWNIDTMPLVFTGGGSLILKNQIFKVFKQKVSLSSNPLNDNLLGLEAVLDYLYGDDGYEG